MSDPRQAIFDSVAKRQRGSEFATGEIGLRGGEPFIIINANNETVVWLASTGRRSSTPLTDFLSRAVDADPVKLAPSNYLDNVWQLASSKIIPMDVRAIAVQRAFRRAPTEADLLTVRRWAGRLSNGVEPTR